MLIGAPLGFEPRQWQHADWKASRLRAQGCRDYCCIASSAIGHRPRLSMGSRSSASMGSRGRRRGSASMGWRGRQGSGSVCIWSFRIPRVPRAWICVSTAAVAVLDLVGCAAVHLELGSRRLCCSALSIASSNCKLQYIWNLDLVGCAAVHCRVHLRTAKWH